MPATFMSIVQKFCACACVIVLCACVAEQRPQEPADNGKEVAEQTRAATAPRKDEQSRPDQKPVAKVESDLNQMKADSTADSRQAPKEPVTEPLADADQRTAAEDSFETDPAGQSAPQDNVQSQQSLAAQQAIEPEVPMDSAPTDPQPDTPDTATPAVTQPDVPKLPASAAADTALQSFSLQGKLALQADDDDFLSSTDDGSSFDDAVIYYVADKKQPAAAAGKYVIETVNKRLSPDVLVIPVGSQVSFPNHDNILHNVFSVSPVSDFDLGFIAPSQSSTHTFDTAGQVLVHCNVHHAMRADILVLDTPFYTQPDSTGRFELDNIPAGGGKLHIWHPQAVERSVEVNVPAANNLQVDLKLVRPRVTPHLNKSGNSYRPERPDS